MKKEILIVGILLMLVGCTEEVIQPQCVNETIYINNTLIKEKIVYVNQSVETTQEDCLSSDNSSLINAWHLRTIQQLKRCERAIERHNVTTLEEELFLSNRSLTKCLKDLNTSEQTNCQSK